MHARTRARTEMRAPSPLCATRLRFGADGEARRLVDSRQVLHTGPLHRRFTLGLKGAGRNWFGRAPGLCGGGGEVNALAVCGRCAGMSHIPNALSLAVRRIPWCRAVRGMRCVPLYVVCTRALGFAVAVPVAEESRRPHQRQCSWRRKRRRGLRRLHRRAHDCATPALLIGPLLPLIRRSVLGVPQNYGYPCQDCVAGIGYVGAICKCHEWVRFFGHPAERCSGHFRAVRCGDG
jgi:hypothetical protein